MAGKFSQIFGQMSTLGFDLPLNGKQALKQANKTTKNKQTDKSPTPINCHQKYKYKYIYI